jgi:hypothetical protein
LTSDQGEYAACAIANTALNVFLFDVVATNCNKRLPFLCQCIEPDDTDLIILTPSFKYGLISYMDHVIHIIVDAWYIYCNNVTQGVFSYPSGTLIPTSNFSIEKINVVSPLSIVYFLQLKETNGSFEHEYQEGSFDFHQSNSATNFSIAIDVPTPGEYEMSVVLDQAAESIVIQNCNTCSALRSCQCMIYLQTSFTVNITGYDQSHFNGRINARFLVS